MIINTSAHSYLLCTLSLPVLLFVQAIDHSPEILTLCQSIQMLTLLMKSLFCSQPELSGFVTTLTVRNMEVANFCAATDTLIGHDGASQSDSFSVTSLFTHVVLIHLLTKFVYVIDGSCSDFTTP